MDNKGVRTITRLQHGFGTFVQKGGSFFLLVRFNLESKWEFKNSFQHTQFNQIYGDGLH